jgi:hypothetical protein
MADTLSRKEVIVLDELGYLPFAQSGGQLLFHLISRLYEQTSIIVTTNLAFGEWPAEPESATPLAEQRERGASSEDHCPAARGSLAISRVKRRNLSGWPEEASSELQDFGKAVAAIGTFQTITFQTI